MELKLDKNKVYAIALEGGGAKGSYQIGVWKALEEAGIRYNAVAGSSVGALNGAMMAMRDLPCAEKMWSNIRFSQVMNVDDDLMQRVFNMDFRNFDEVRAVAKSAAEVVRGGGFDVEPLRRLLVEVIDEDRVRASDVNFYLVTYSITDRKELDIDTRDLNPGELHDMLLASAYFPAFKNEKLGGKRYTDGGVQDVVPIDSLISREYKDLIVIRIFGVGVEKRVKIPEDVHITTVAPLTDLGNVLNFSSEQARENMRLGYYDAQRVLYGLYGKTYYIDRTWTEQEAYERLLHLARMQEPKATLRTLHEEILPDLAREVGAKGDYYDVLIALMEKTATELLLDPYAVTTDAELYGRIEQAASHAFSARPSPLLRRITESLPIHL